MKCPYGNHDTNKPICYGEKFCVCGACGKSSSVVTHSTIDGYKYRLVKTGRKLSVDPKRVRSIRLSNSEMIAIENGNLILTVRDNRITLTV